MATGHLEPLSFGHNRRFADSARRIGERLWSRHSRVCAIAAVLFAFGCHDDLIAIQLGSSSGGSGASGNCAKVGDSCDPSNPNLAQCCGNAWCGSLGSCMAVDSGTSCTPFGQPCLEDNSCCDFSACQIVAQSSTRMCVGVWCQRLGAPCSFDGECCSFSCQGGYCSNSHPCGVQGEKCTVDTDCCSNNCFNGNCGSSSGSCVVTADSCKNSDECCSKSCENVAGVGLRCLTKTCAFFDDNCTESTECCSKSCVNYRCTQPQQQCGIYNSFCSRDSDCCYQHCIASSNGQGPSTCSGCLIGGAACADPSNCCSSQCLDDGTGQLQCAPQ